MKRPLVRIMMVTGALACLGAVACSKDPEVAKQEHLARGNAYFDQSQYAAAILEYRNALQLDSRFAPARYKLAQAYDKSGDGMNAAREFIRSADLMPEDADAQVRAGLYLLATRQFEDAKTRARKALELDPRHIEAHLVLAEATAAMNDTKAAISEIEATIKMDPSEPRPHTRLGSFWLAEGNIKRAEEAFQNAVGVDPSSASAHFGLARFYLSTGRPAEAEVSLKKALALAPKDTLINRAVASFYVSSGRPQEAEAPLKAYAENAPGFQGWVTLADYYFSFGRKDAARRILEEWKNDRDGFVEVNLRLSILEHSAGRKPEAMKILESVLAKQPQDPTALILKGRYLLDEGQVSAAKQTFGEAIAAVPEHGDAHFWLGVSQRRQGENEAARASFGESLRLQPTSLRPKVQLAEMNFVEGKFDSASELINQAVAQNPGDFHALLLRTEVLIARGALNEAERSASAVAAAAPKRYEPQMQLGRIAMLQRDFQKADRAFHKGLDLSAPLGAAVGAIIEARLAAGRVNDAAVTVSKALDANPRDPGLLVASARVHSAAKEPSKAEQALRDALAVDASNLEAYSALSRLYMEQSRLPEARQQLEAIVAKQPRAIWAHTLIAMSLQVENRVPEAKQRYQKILEMEPRAVVAANNLAMVIVDEGGNLDLALQLAQTAKQQMPDSPEVNDTLGWVYFKKGLFAQAAQSFELSVSRDPSVPLYQYHLGLAYADSGQNAKARAALRRALEIDAKFEGADDARRRLASL